MQIFNTSAISLIYEMQREMSNELQVAEHFYFRAATIFQTSLQLDMTFTTIWLNHCCTFKETGFRYQTQSTVRRGQRSPSRLTVKARQSSLGNTERCQLPTCAAVNSYCVR